MTTTASIQNQVRLPLRVAFEVVAQGIRIRFGRSVVTITGVVFGIAFLMSILTGQVLKRGVAAEEELRTEVGRYHSFLVAEMGSPRDKTVAVVLGTDPSPAELRLLDRLMQDGLAVLRIADEGTVPPARGKTRIVREVVGTDNSALLVFGGTLKPERATQLLAGARQPVVAFTRPMARLFLPGARMVQLGAAPTPEQVERLALEKSRERFRNGWIILISLLVTVIGISNAMLMSVTERFREIGTMKCLGALSGFVRTMFLIESAFMGLVGGIVGCLVGFGFSIIAYAFTYGAGLVWISLGEGIGILGLYALGSLAAGLVLSVLAALYPAQVASNMVPAHALRSNV
jgi:hypothetical protein